MSGLFSSRALWSWPIRLSGYWAVVVAFVFLGYGLFGRLPARDFFSVVAEAWRGDLGRVSTEAFALSLATIISALAVGLAVAHLLFHLLLIKRSIAEARALVRSAKTKADFVANYDLIYAELSEHPLLGHAWIEFDETLVKTKGPIRNTLRPQAFFNTGLLKDRLIGLKFMSSIPGYFVGVGLLLTFVGLVIALSKAAMATGAVRMVGAGSGAEAMQGALRELLQAATFKFSTSIAGLAASIVLSLLFRLYIIGVESSLSSFSEALEEKLDYVAPQSVSLTMVEQLEAQLTELKAINSEQFFAKLGQEVGPSIQGAMSGVMTPLVDQVGAAVEKLSTHSQSGVEDLLDRFTENLQSGAGSELRDLAASLHSIQMALEQTRAGISGSGEDFSRQMTATAENLNRLVLEAGQSLGKSSEQNRETLEQILASLQTTFETANLKVEQRLESAASGASDRLESAMSRVLNGLEGQVTGLQQTLGGFQEGSAKFVEDAQNRVIQAQDQSIEAMTRSSVEAMEHARATISGSGDDFARAASGASDRLESAMSRVLAGLEGQVTGLQQTLGAFHAGTTKFVDETQSKVKEAQEQSVDAISRAAANAAASLEKGLSDLLKEMRKEIEAMVAALRASETSLAAQSKAIDLVAVRSRESADAFGQSAQAIRAAVDPVTRSNEKLSGATQTMAEAVERSIASLNESQISARALSESLERHSERVIETWRQYEARFSQVDEDLAGAFDKLANETTKWREAVTTYTVEIDDGLSKSVDRLATFLQGLESGAEDLGDAAQQMKEAIRSGVRELIP